MLRKVYGRGPTELQNSAACLVLGLQSRDHIKPALFELHWLPVHLRTAWIQTLSADAFCFCSELSQLHQWHRPDYCCIISSTATTFLYYTDTLSYTVPPTVTKFGERAFSVAGPSVWNSLPADIRHITYTSVFKRHLKTHFLTCILIFSCFRYYALSF